ncbi:MAG: hypothetical protein J6X33_03160 [Clostridiales bacterium]|nr:hypothetical protein [Clostridiales bacterium]
MKKNSQTKNASISAPQDSGSPLRYLMLLAPFVIILMAGSATVGSSETLMILLWYTILFLFSLIMLPVAFKIFGRFGAGGFFASKVLGLVTVSFVVWTLTYIRLFRFNYVFVVIAILLVGFCCYFPKSLRNNLVDKLGDNYLIEKIVLEEVVFAVVLVILCYIKGFEPNIKDQEKFMDYGFIMSMLRNPELPAKDMWLAGLNINYYYFGQFIWALVIKLSCLSPKIAYNLAMVSAIAIPFGMSFSFGVMLTEGAQQNGFHENRFLKYVTGLIAGLATCIFGNSHSFFYDENGAGNGFLRFLSDQGFNVGKTDGFFYPDSTRFIGWNPKIETDYTIEEFPFYSFLIGDLHAHVVSMMTVLLIAMIVFAMVLEAKAPSSGPSNTAKHLKLERFPKDEYKVLLTPHIIMVAILLGISQMTNYWDFLIYFIFCSMAMLLANTRKTARFSSIPSAIVFAGNIIAILAVYLMAGNNVLVHIALQLIVLIISYILAGMFPSALSRTSFGMSFLFVVSHIAAAPFNLNFDMISNALGKVKSRSSLFQLAILWGTHLIICLTFFVITVITRNYQPGSSDKKGKKGKKSSLFYASENENRCNPIASFISDRNIVDVFVCGMIVVGILIVIAPEIFYVRDIYTSGYLRANTMFKFAFAAFIIFSVAMSYAVTRLFFVVTKKGTYSLACLIVAWVFVAMLFIPAHYTKVATEQRSGEITRENYEGLDGQAFIDNYQSEWGYIETPGNLVSYRDAADWFNENVKGSPVICEAAGESYKDYNMVSAYTGLPTVLGWQTHEWLWRFHGIVNPETDIIESDPKRDVWAIYLTPRYDDVDKIYQSDDVSEIREVINKYHIEYIILGNLEYNKYDYDNTATLEQLGEIVFSSENLNVFKVKPA